MDGLTILVLAITMSFFVVLGFFIGYNNSTHKILGGIVGLIFTAGIFFLSVFCCKTQGDITAEKYNNGICTICGGEYEFAGGSRYRNHSEYYYTCENCGHTITTSSIMK